MRSKRLLASAAISLLATSAMLSTTASASSNSKTLSFTVYQPYFTKSPLGTAAQKVWTQDMEKYLGVKLNITWDQLPFSTFLGKESTYLASGNLADVSLLTSQQDINTAGNEGAIVNLMPYLKKGDMPYYAKWLKQNDNLAKVESNGHLYYFSNGLYNGPSTQFGTQETWMVRYDIFQKYHIPIPQSLNQVYTDALRLKKLFPKSYPVGSQWAGTGGVINIDTVFAHMNHTEGDVYFNGLKYVFGPSADYGRYKATIEFLHKLYAQKLLDPNFLTISSSQFPSLADSGEFFMVPNGFGEDLNPSQGGSLNTGSFKGQWVAIPVPKNLYGQVSWHNASDGPGYQMDPRWGSVISSKANNIPLLVKLLDYQYSPQIFNLYNYGIQGKTFQLVNGKPQFLPSILKTKNHEPPIDKPLLQKLPVGAGSGIRIGIQWIPENRDAENQMFGLMPVYLHGKITWDGMWSFTSQTSDGLKSVDPNNFAPSLPLSAQQQTQIANDTTALSTYMNEQLAKFILGQESFSQWPQFVKQAESIGNVQQVVSWDNAALKTLETQNHWSYRASVGK